MPATIDKMANHKLKISSARCKSVGEVSDQLLDSRATQGLTSEHYRGNNEGEVVFASKDYLKQE